MNSKTNVPLAMVCEAGLQLAFWILKSRGVEMPEEAKMAAHTFGLGAMLFAMPESWLARIKSRSGGA